MQAAVWSQPHSSNSYVLSGIGSRRKSSGYQPGTLSDISLSPPIERLSLDDDDIESFSPVNGRPVLALGLALIISGSVLGLFGLAGLFSSGEARLSIGLGALAALMAVLAGVSGSRAGKNFSKNKRLAIECVVFSVLCTFCDVVCITFCVRIIVNTRNRLLGAIAGAEVTLAAIDLLLSIANVIVTTHLICKIPKKTETDENTPKEQDQIVNCRDDDYKPV
ncbi:Uncharacterised protein r2_g1630 [Pycnogonum litorale]